MRCDADKISGRNARAFSLVEVMIAVGILGIGLTMIASIFPVALSEHRDSAEASSAVTFARRAMGLMQAKLANATLWRPYDPAHPGVATILAGNPAPWMALPVQNIDILNNPPPYGTWNAGGYGTANYGSILSNPVLFFGGAPLPAANAVNNAIYLDRDDLVSDLPAPVDDAAAENVPSRLVWYPFYRETESHTFQYAAAVCRQLRGQKFVGEDVYNVSIIKPNPFINPVAAGGNPLRFPVRWRVQVRHDDTPAARRNLYVPAGNDIPLGWMAPAGSKIMLTGWVDFAQSPAPAIPKPIAPAGRILTVAGVKQQPNNNIVEILEDMSDLPDFLGAGNPTFDIFVFPPPYVGAVAGQNPFGPKSPLVEWVIF